MTRTPVSQALVIIKQGIPAHPGTPAAQLREHRSTSADANGIAAQSDDR